MINRAWYSGFIFSSNHGYLHLAIRIWVGIEVTAAKCNTLPTLHRKSERKEEIGSWRKDKIFGEPSKL